MINFKIKLNTNKIKMNSIGFHDVVKPQISLTDPYNYPMLNRNMGMSMNTITSTQDYVKTNT